MTLLEAVAAGILQGLLEWLPVSSSGQVSLYYSVILGVDPGIAYRLGMAAHLGTAISGLIVLRREFASMLHGSPWLRVAAIPTLTALPIGWLVSQIVQDFNGDLLNAVIGIMLIATGIILYSAKPGHRRIETLRPGELALVGVFEGLAALPGLSRSGVTLAALAAMGAKPVDAVRASLIMGVPVTLAAGAYYMLESTRGIVDPLQALAMGVSSLLAGLLSAYFMLGLARRLDNHLPRFLIALGLLILAYYMPALAS